MLIQVLDYHHVRLDDVVHEQRSAAAAADSIERLADFAVPTDAPIPLLTLTTAVRDSLALEAALHPGRRRDIRVFQRPARVTRDPGRRIAIGAGNAGRRGRTRPSQVLLRFLLAQ